MHQNKSNRFARYQLMLTAILLVACLSLLAAATWARYQTDEVSYLEFAAKTLDSISIQTDGNQGWVFSEGSGSFSFYINNSADGADYAAEDQPVSVRLLASLSLEEIEGEKVQLRVSDGVTTSVYTAVSRVIKEGTALYKTFGAGRVYIFQDENGNEMSCTLKGGTESVLSAQLIITGLNKPENPALLQLQVVGR